MKVERNRVRDGRSGGFLEGLAVEDQQRRVAGVGVERHREDDPPVLTGRFTPRCGGVLAAGCGTAARALGCGTKVGSLRLLPSSRNSSASPESVSILMTAVGHSVTGRSVPCA
jgi:hypothetical protein